MCKLIIAVTMLVSIPMLFVLEAQAAPPGPASVLQRAAKTASPLEAAACARRRVCGSRGCAWRTVCRRW
jgi:hypothetical protein